MLSPIQHKARHIFIQTQSIAPAIKNQQETWHPEKFYIRKTEENNSFVKTVIINTQESRTSYVWCP